jgi:hypothetical protein
MLKLAASLVILAMIAHLIRPFGLPGLRRRADAWKLALLAFAIVSTLAVLRSQL